jgi:hypothetical protein
LSSFAAQLFLAHIGGEAADMGQKNRFGGFAAIYISDQATDCIHPDD